MKYVIATGIYPPEIGGPATVIKKLVDDLVAAGHDVRIVTYGEPRKNEPRVIAVPRLGNALVRYLRMARLIRSLMDPLTVVLATDVFSVGIPVRLALVGKPNKLISRISGEWFWEDAVEKRRTYMPLKRFWSSLVWSPRIALAKINYRWQLKRASRIAVTADLLTDVLKAVCPTILDRVVTVGNVAVPQSIAHVAGRPHKPLRLLYVGRFARVKNVPSLARVLKLLKEQGLDIACVFAGDGPTLEETKAILGGIPGMEYLGVVAHDQIQSLFADTDVLALPSLTDICPNIVLEALASSVPVLMTKEHGLPPGFGGVVELPPMDQAAWMAAIRRLSDSEEYGRLRAQISLPVKPQLGLIELLTGV